MSVMVIGGVPAQLTRGEITGGAGGEGKSETTVPQPQPRPEAAAPASGGSPAYRPGAFHAEAPAGTDPDLWAMLTAEERDLFARMNTMGPLTYGRPTRAASAGEQVLTRGGRLDVRA